MQNRPLKFVLLIVTSIFFFGCQKAEKAEFDTNSATSAKTVETPKTLVETPIVNLPIEVTKLANKPAHELDKFFGKPEEVKSAGNGEYRLYRLANEPKGLAVRFYGGKAKSFNLIVSKPFSSSKAALKQVFGLDVGNIPPGKDVKEPLSEKYQGTFDGVKFSKISAKKDEKGQGFIFVLAEVAR